MRTPNTFILGAAKCGTTSLYYYLNQHPDVYFAEPKEPVFFEAEYERGLTYYWDRYFSGWQCETVVGEARHRNLYLPYVPRRIKESISDPRFIVILRQPIERAYSHWMSRYVNGKEELSFPNAIYEDLDRIGRGITFEDKAGAEMWARSLVPGQSAKGVASSGKFRTYVDTGYYSQQIRRYLELFPRTSFRIVFLEDLARDSERVISGLCRFLGIDPDMRSADYTPQNVSVNKPNVRKKLYGPLFDLLQRLPTRIERLIWRLTWRVYSPSMNPTIRALLCEHYYVHNRDLEKLVGRDLSSWDR